MCVCVCPLFAVPEQLQEITLQFIYLVCHLCLGDTMSAPEQGKVITKSCIRSATESKVYFDYVVSVKMYSSPCQFDGFPNI